MKNKIFILCLLFCLSSLMYAYPPMKVNDSGVRLRESPGLEGNIIRVLAKEEPVTMLSSRLYENDPFQWINVKTNTGEGWVYGEYVSLIGSTIPYKFNSIGDVKLPVDNGFIEIGMKKESLIKLLGEPTRVSIDDEYNEESLEFFYKGRLSVVVTRYNNRVNQFTLYVPEQALINNIKVGIPITTISANNDIKVNSSGPYSLNLANYFRPSEFDAYIMLNTNQQGIITRIQVGGNS